MKGRITNVDAGTFTRDFHSPYGGVEHRMATGREFTLTVKLVDPTQEELNALYHQMPQRPIIDFRLELPVAPPSVAPENAHVSGSNPAAGSW